MAPRYNSPPNWPTPPAGWTPPEGWQPDPEWGPAPDGWNFWIQEQNWFLRHKTASIVGGVVVLLLLVCCGIGVAASPGEKAVSRAPASAMPSPSATPSPSSPSVSPSTPKPATSVPDVVGQRLTAAMMTMSAAGYTNVEPVDASGDGRPVLNPENWTVRAQTPQAGTKATTTSVITLKVVKPSDGAGSDSVTTGMVPNVVCRDLQTAQDTMQAAGFYNLGSEDGTGQGRAQVADRNWVVIAQSARAGTRPDPGTRVVLRAVKFGEPTGKSGCRN
jgi:beta-lactam-binding protein with PASTA domain